MTRSFPRWSNPSASCHPKLTLQWILPPLLLLVISAGIVTVGDSWNEHILHEPASSIHATTTRTNEKKAAGLSTLDKNDYLPTPASDRLGDLIQLHGQVLRFYQSRSDEGLPLVEERFPGLAWGNGIWEEGQNRTYFRSHYPLLTSQSIWDNAADHFYQRGGFGWDIPVSYSTSRAAAESIKNGDVVFINQEWIHWLDDVAPLVIATANVTLVLFDGDSYFCAGESQDRLRSLDFVSRIFVPNACQHPKVTPLPLGLMDNIEHPMLNSKYWTIHGDEAKVAKILLEGAKRQNKMGVYCDMNVENNLGERLDALELCKRLGKSTRDEYKVNVGTLASKRVYRPWEEYIEELSKHRFVISPEGNGFDCHRTWESLMVGSIPVVKYTEGMDDVFDGLPVLLVKSWEEVKEETLDEVWNEVVNTSTKRGVWQFEKLFAPYWIDRIRDKGISLYSDAFNRYKDPAGIFS